MSATEQGLGTWNRSIIQTLSPTIALIVIYCITGVIGNGTVLIIYKTKNLSRKGRFFIPILAFVDLCASVVCSICVLFRLCFNVLFVSDILCKGLFFIICWVFNTSILIVFAIAFDRFRMVCQMKKKQLSYRHKWIIVGSIVVLTTFFNCSVFVTSGTIPVSMPLQNNSLINGSVCVLTKHLSPTFETLHSIFSGGVIAGIFICVMFFNAKISYVVCTKLRRSIKVSNSSQQHINIDSCSTEEHLECVLESGDHIEHKDKGKNNVDGMKYIRKMSLNLEVKFPDKKNKNSSEENITPIKDIDDHDVESTFKPTKRRRQNIETSAKADPVSRKKDAIQNIPLRTAFRKHSISIHLMFFVMFIIMFVSYIPSLTIALILYNDHKPDNLWVSEGQNALDVNVSFIFQTSFLLSSAINPYIYSLFDRKFQNILIGILKRLQ